MSSTITPSGHMTKHSDCSACRRHNRCRTVPDATHWFASARHCRGPVRWVPRKRLGIPDGVTLFRAAGGDTLLSCDDPQRIEHFTRDYHVVLDRIPWEVQFVAHRCNQYIALATPDSPVRAAPSPALSADATPATSSVRPVTSNAITGGVIPTRPPKAAYPLC